MFISSKEAEKKKLFRFRCLDVKSDKTEHLISKLLKLKKFTCTVL